MDDSCAVCAETLEWVAYGSCGHKDVCSTCVARLRFICDDRRCCICKSQSDVVFITRVCALFPPFLIFIYSDSLCFLVRFIVISFLGSVYLLLLDFFTLIGLSFGLLLGLFF